MRIAIILIFTFAACVHLENQNLIDYSEKEYLQSLNTLKNKLTTDWNKIKQEIRKVQTRLKQYEDNSPEQLGVLQQSLAEERDILSRIQEYMGLPFDLKPCTKNFNLTDRERTSFQNQIEKIRDSIGRLRVNVNECGDCVRMVQIRNQIQRQEKILTSVQNIVNTQCRKGPRQFIEDVALGFIDLGISVPITNLKARNWAYGNISASQYKFTLFALGTKFNTSKCPIDKPFAVKNLTPSQQCIRCPQDKPLFILSQRQCVPCPPGTFFNQNKGNCTQGQHIIKPPQKTYNNNPTALNFIGMRPLFNEKLQTCPEDRPFTDGVQCVVCNQPLIFNFQTETCVKCPNNMAYDLNLHRCVAPQRQRDSNLDEVQNWVTERSIQSVLSGRRKEVCSVETPYYDGMKCITCPLPKAFNIDSLLCVTPIEPYVFNENLHKIVRRMQPPKNTRPDSRNLLLQPGVSAPTEKSNLCPVQSPYWDNITCVDCQEPRPIFNYKSQLCTRCSNGKIFNQETHKCQSLGTHYYTNLNARNIWIPQGTTMEQVVKQEQRRRQGRLLTEQCPIDKPYLIKTVCDSCPLNLPIYNITNGNCEVCQSNSYFEQSSHSCVLLRLITNSEAPNIVQSNNQYQLLKNAKQSATGDKVKECPMSKPYFNGMQCIACPEKQPLFSLKSLACMSCPDGSTYSADQRMCRKVHYMTSGNAPNLIYSGDINQYREQLKKKQSEGHMECAADTPYSIGDSCIKCEPPTRLFDMDSKKCSSCPNGLFYHPEKLRCTTERVEVRSSLEKMLMNIG